MTPEQMREMLHDHEGRLKIHESFRDEMKDYIKQSLDTQKKTNEILAAWGDAKGFIRVVSIGGKVILWITAIGGAIAYFIKTGQTK